MTTNWRYILIVPLVLFAIIITGKFVTTEPFYLIAALMTVIAAIATFKNPSNGALILVYTMLLSPEIAIGKIPGRELSIRVDDLIIIAVFVAWLAHLAVDKERNVFVKTPFDKLLIFLTVLYVTSTSLGILFGYVTPLKGFFFTLKYIEYFLIFWIVANTTTDKATIQKYLWAGFITFVIVTIYAYSLFTVTDRVYAPFDSQAGGEPASLGGYFIIIFALLFSFMLHFEKGYQRLLCGIAIILLLPPFVKTLSRASYFAFLPMVLTVLFLTKQRRIQFALALLAGAALFPLLFPELYTSMVDRVQYTFTGSHLPGYRDVVVGGTKISDQSALERILSWERTINVYFKRNFMTMLIGNGVTGIRFTEGQFFVVIGEIGILGVIAFYWLQLKIILVSYKLYNIASDVVSKSLPLAMIAAIAGLTFHAITTNTYIIVRIMEPFWFLAAMVAVLYELEITKIVSDKKKPGLAPAGSL